MQYLTNLFAAIFLTSCMGTPYKEPAVIVLPNSKVVTTTLRDSLGSVTFSIPARFDTSFTWTNSSDCGKPCDYEQYRFQSKRLRVFKESGFYYHNPNIPIDQFTIVHSGYFPFSDNVDTSKNFVRHEHFRRSLSGVFNDVNMVYDTIEKINDRYFSIAYMKGYDKVQQKYFTKVAALTTIKGNEIQFRYEMKTKDTINEKQFYDTSAQFIRTIRITNGI